MANKNNPIGLKPINNILTAGYTGSTHKYYIPSSDTTDLWLNDAVKLTHASNADGISIITKAAAGEKSSGMIVGVYDILGTQSYICRKAGEERYVEVVDDPWVEFEAQVNGTITTADVGKCIDIVVGNGNDSTGISGTQLDLATLTSDSAQVRILSRIEKEDNEFGLYTHVRCIWAEHEYKDIPLYEEQIFNRSATGEITPQNAGDNLDMGTGDITGTNGTFTGKLTVTGAIDPTMLVLDAQSAAPGTDNGSIYYDSTTNKFKFRENGSWENLEGSSEKNQIYYVTDPGDDTNGGKDINDGLATLQRGIDLATIEVPSSSNRYEITSIGSLVLSSTSILSFTSSYIYVNTFGAVIETTESAHMLENTSLKAKTLTLNKGLSRNVGSGAGISVTEADYYGCTDVGGRAYQILEGVHQSNVKSVSATTAQNFAFINGGAALYHTGIDVTGDLYISNTGGTANIFLTGNYTGDLTTISPGGGHIRLFCLGEYSGDINCEAGTTIEVYCSQWAAGSSVGAGTLIVHEWANVSTAQWGYLSAMNQGVATTDDVVFKNIISDNAGLFQTSVDIWKNLTLGSGSSTNNGKLTIKDQANNDIVILDASSAPIGNFGTTASRITDGWFVDIESTNMPTVSGTSINNNNVLNLTSAEVAQLANINAAIIPFQPWLYLGAMDQYVSSDSTVIHHALTLAGLTASHIVETDGAKKLASAAKNTAYNKNFGIVAGSVLEGNNGVLKNGRVGGQTIFGGTQAGDDLQFNTTTDVTKGSYIFIELTTANGILRNNASGVVTSSIDLPNGTTATTQSPIDNSSKLATTAYADAAADRYGRRAVEDKIANYDVALTDYGKVFTNAGATGAIIFALPITGGTTIGLELFFHVRAAQTLTLDPSGADKVRNLANVYNTIYSNTIGNCVKIICVAAGEWIVQNMRGTWSTT